jgi:hypothetical protein
MNVDTSLENLFEGRFDSNSCIFVELFTYIGRVVVQTFREDVQKSSSPSRSTFQMYQSYLVGLSRTESRILCSGLNVARTTNLAYIYCNTSLSKTVELFSFTKPVESNILKIYKITAPSCLSYSVQPPSVTLVSGDPLKSLLSMNEQSFK